MKDKLIIVKTRIINSNKFILKFNITKKVLSIVLTRSFIRYLIIGFSTFFMQLFLLFVFSQLLNLEKIIANIFSTLLSMIFNFTMSNFWTFKLSSKSSGKKLGKYIMIASFNYIFDVIIAFPFLASTLKVNQYISKIIITGVIVCWNFLIYKLWVFKE